MEESVLSLPTKYQLHLLQMRRRLLSNLYPSHISLPTRHHLTNLSYPTTGEDEYIDVIQSQPEIIDTISEIDLDAYITKLTTTMFSDDILQNWKGVICTGHGGVGLTD